MEQSYIAEDVIRDFEDHIEYAEAECITGMRQRGDSRRYQIKYVTLQLTGIMCLPFLQAVHYGAVPKAAALLQPAPHLPYNEVQPKRNCAPAVEPTLICRWKDDYPETWEPEEAVSEDLVRIWEEQQGQQQGADGSAEHSNGASRPQQKQAPAFA